MRQNTPITFVVAVNKRDVLGKNFLASPLVRDPHPHQILLQENFSSAALAYNDAIEKSANDLIVFCHQDMFFPDSWMPQFSAALEYLKSKDPNWGVLGCSGVTAEGRFVGHMFSQGVGIVGKFSDPVAVRSLDEIVLVLRKSSGLRFDDKLPHFHLYGTDICLQAERAGMKSYAISAFCVHNTYTNYTLPKEFYECCEYIRRGWKGALPIQTTCIRITSLSFAIHYRMLKDTLRNYIRRERLEVVRGEDGEQVFEELSDKV